MFSKHTSDRKIPMLNSLQWLSLVIRIKSKLLEPWKALHVLVPALKELLRLSYSNFNFIHSFDRNLFNTRHGSRFWVLAVNKNVTHLCSLISYNSPLSPCIWATLVVCVCVCCFSHIHSLFLPQDLCTCSSLHLVHSPPTSSRGWVVLIIQV